MLERMSLMACVVAMCTTSASAEFPLHLELSTDDLDKPCDLKTPPGETDRLFVVEQFSSEPTGRIWIIKNGSLLATPFLEIPDVANQFSQGLVCMAFDPDYATNGHFYVDHMDAAGDVFVARYTVSADPDIADPSSRHEVMTIPQPHRFHNGGWIAFGPDGYLWMSSGDGGPLQDPDHRGQDLASLLGKILRIDVHGDDFPSDPARNYAIPPDNPFVGTAPLDEIWAYGVREPWRCAWDPETGDFYFADVGEDHWEEINVEPAGSGGGLNYGWRCREGKHDFMVADSECGGASLIDPVLDYPIENLPQCSVIGGYVYRGDLIPGLRGRYLFSDWCTSQIWSFRYEDGEATALIEHDLEDLVGAIRA